MATAGTYRYQHSAAYSQGRIHGTHTEPVGDTRDQRIPGTTHSGDMYQPTTTREDVCIRWIHGSYAHPSHEAW